MLSRVDWLPNGPRRRLAAKRIPWLIWLLVAGAVMVLIYLRVAIGIPPDFIYMG